MGKLATGFYLLAVKGYLRWLPDTIFLKIQYRLTMHKKADLKDPKTFSEKLQWLKLNDRNPAYTQMVDKYAVKELVAEKIGREHVIPTLGVWDHFDEIDFDKLPDRFVLKCTHDSGSIVICRDKKTFNRDAARKKLDVHLNVSHYDAFREWPYKDVKPRIIAEQYMTDENGDLPDYKFFCFDGVPKFVLFMRERFSGKGVDTFFCDMNWEPLDLQLLGARSTGNDIQKPEKLEEMIECVKKLSEGIRCVRVDLYIANNNVYFGEMTFFPVGGYWKLSEAWDEKLGEMIGLDRP